MGFYKDGHNSAIDLLRLSGPWNLSGSRLLANARDVCFAEFPDIIVAVGSVETRWQLRRGSGLIRRKGDRTSSLKSAFSVRTFVGNSQTHHSFYGETISLACSGAHEKQ